MPNTITALIAYINQYINANGKGAITGPILATVLITISTFFYALVPNLGTPNAWTAQQTFSAGIIVSPPLNIGSGGTGAATQPAARAALGAAANGANTDITSLSGLTTPLSQTQGGTGLTTTTGFTLHVANTAALQAIGVAANAVYIRDGQFTAGDGGQATYVGVASACTLNSGAGDQGSEIAASGGCWKLTAQYAANVGIWPVKPNNAGFDSAPGIRSALAWSTLTGNKIVLPGASTYQLNSLDPTGLGVFIAGPNPATTTTSAQNSGDTQITVSSLTGFSASGGNNEIGIQQVDGSLSTNTVTAINTGTNVLTLGGALTQNVATGANVWQHGVNAAKSWALEGPAPIGSPSTTCGISMPKFTLGAGLNRPIFFDHPDTFSPTLKNLCMTATTSLQTGFAGGPGGRLYAIQMGDSKTGLNENAMVFENIGVFNAYNGGIYQGFGRGHVNAYNLTIQYVGQNTTDPCYYFTAYDTTIINPEFGECSGPALFVKTGIALEVIGGALFGSYHGVEIAGGQVAQMTVTSSAINGNTCGGIYEDNLAPSSRVSGHTFVAIQFDSNSFQGNGQCPDVTVGQGSWLNLDSPMFGGGATNPGAGTGTIPNYNIFVGSGGGTVNVTNPTFGVTPVPFTVAWSDNAASVNCANCLSATGVPLTQLQGTSAAIVATTTQTGLSIANGSGVIAQIIGTSGTNDSAALALFSGLSKKISLNSNGGQSYLNGGPVNVGANTACSNSEALCVSGPLSMTTGLIALGSGPGFSGSCATGMTTTGGATAGTMTRSTACTSSSFSMSFVHTSPNGWNCAVQDRTTPADTLTQTASSATSATISGTFLANDVLQYQCVGY